MSNSDSDVIRRQMALIRRELSDDVDAVVEQAKELADWRNFVRRHPFLSVSAAAAIGFVLVPKRLNIMSPDAETLEKLSKQNRLVVKPKAEVRRQAATSVAAPIISLITGAILRSTMAIAGQQVGKIMAPPAEQQSGQTT